MGCYFSFLELADPNLNYYKDSGFTVLKSQLIGGYTNKFPISVASLAHSTALYFTV